MKYWTLCDNGRGEGPGYNYKGLLAAVEEMKQDIKKTPVEYD